jgi:hypothetical protein
MNGFSSQIRKVPGLILLIKLFLVVMVYTELYIVAGILFSKDQIIQALKVAKVNFDENDEDSLLELKDIFYENLIRPHEQYGAKAVGPNLRIFGFPCCSDSLNKFYILGYVIHTYYRRHVQCKDCGEHSVCDLCIGETNNGWYDVDTIANKPSHVPADRMCCFCGSDQVEANHRCKLCFRKNLERREHYVEASVKRFAHSILHLDAGDCIVSNYLMLNDCLSCT